MFETARLDVELEVGEINTTVDIAADAAVLQTESSELGRVLIEKQSLTRPVPQLHTDRHLVASVSAGVTTPRTRSRIRGESGGAFRPTEPLRETTTFR
jgi:hypothetical protein